MKKILFTALLFCISIATNAQEITATKKAKHKVGLSVQASVLSAVAGPENNEYLYSVTNRAKLGYRIGFTCNIPLGKKFAFAPSFNYVNKGTKTLEIMSDIIDAGYIKDIVISTSHIEIPLNFTATFGRNKNIVVGLGPVVSYGIGGTVKGTIISDWLQEININSSVKFDGSSKYDGNTHFKAFEVGGNIMLGYKFSPKYSLSAIYNTSFTNSAPNRDGYANTYKTSYWGLNFGYSFF